MEKRMEQQIFRRPTRASDKPGYRLFGICSRTHPDPHSRSTMPLRRAGLPERDASHAHRGGRASIGMAEGTR
jgi:hypothetical protein